MRTSIDRSKASTKPTALDEMTGVDSMLHSYGMLGLCSKSLKGPGYALTPCSFVRHSGCLLQKSIGQRSRIGILTSNQRTPYYDPDIQDFGPRILLARNCIRCLAVTAAIRSGVSRITTRGRARRCLATVSIPGHPNAYCQWRKVKGATRGGTLSHGHF